MRVREIGAVTQLILGGGPLRQYQYEIGKNIMDLLYREGAYTRLGLSNYSSWEVARCVEICRKHDWLAPSVYQVTTVTENQIFNPHFTSYY